MSFEVGEDGILRFVPWTAIDWLVHGFSTRAAGDFARPEPTDAAARFGAPEAELVTLRQTHSALVFDIWDVVRAGGSLEGDGLHSDRSATIIGVRTADCLPLLLLDRARRRVAAVHAGWRGSAARIAAHAVAALEEAGSPPESLEAVIGPCIGAARYEVGPEVAERFEHSAVVEREDWLKPHLDLATANRLQLQAAGVPGDSIHGGGMCTYDEADRFHSHRRDQAQAGRMLAAIGIR